ncbi:MAG: efflux RND transporter permease subunit [bacterium]
MPVLDEGAPELHVIPRREEAAELGVASSELAFVADTYIDGRKIGEWSREGEPKIDVMLRSDVRDEEEARRMLEDAPVATKQGDVVPFSVLAELDTKLGPTVVRRVERRRSVTLQVTPPDNVPFEAAIDALQTKVIEPLIASGELPPNVTINLGGSAGKLKAAQTQFAWVLLIALLISFFLMAALFEDFLAPVVVLVTIPLAAAGGVIGLRLVNQFVGEQPLDIMSAVGFLILIGVVVNNAILIVDRAMGRLREGASIEESINGAVADRVRPIFMSTFTSLAGLLPMAVAVGAGSELYRGVGAILLGGLFLSTILTLFVVPSLFSLIWRVRSVFVPQNPEPAE